MCLNRKPTPPADAPVRIKNAACPRCGGPVYWTRARWVFCPACPVRVAITRTARRAAG